ncbi:type VI secretion system TssO [Terrimonas rubra]|uniref:Type VI secretion system TssO n=1 Tax=Terrimonas rubra TaxID=1035890 RepID=A0ABW6A3V8_9BACT
MKPQNSQERNKAFGRFIIFYVLTTVLIILAVYFGLQVPFKQNKQLQAQIEVLQGEKDFSQRFSSLLAQTKSLLDTVNSSGARIDLVEGQIAQKIQEMDAMLAKDSTANKALYQQILQTLTDIKNDKKTIRSEDKNQLLTVCEQEKISLEKLKGEYEKQNSEMRQQILILNTQLQQR